MTTVVSDKTSNTEAYRSGHNGPDSKSCGELSVSSSRNRVTMRVLPGSKIELACCSFRQFFPKPFSIGKRQGKTAAEHRGRVIEVVITSRTRNAVVRKGTWVRIPHSPPSKNPVTMRVSGFFFFCARFKNHPVLGCSFHKFWKEQLFALFPAFFCVLLPSAAEIARFGKRHSAHHRLR